MVALPMFTAEAFAIVLPREPSTWPFLAGAGIILVALWLGRKSRWIPGTCAVAATALAGLGAADLHHEVRDPIIQQIIWQPGIDRAAVLYLCACLPLALSIVALFRARSLSMRAARIWAASVVLAPIVLLVGANLADYVQFTGVLRRARGLTEAQLKALAKTCAEVREPSGRSEGSWPAEFDVLKPRFVSLRRSLSYASLYERGDVYFEFRVETSPHRQQIYFFTNSDGPQKTTVLWDSNPEFTKRANPAGRIVTITAYGLHLSKDWIALRDRVMIVDHPGTVGSEETIVWEAPLSESDRVAIEQEVASLRRRLGGKAYSTPVVDGLNLEVHFSPDGSPSPGDIALNNAWVDDATALGAIAARLSPSVRPFAYGRELRELQDNEFKDLPVRIRGVTELADEHPRLPWWCVWRKLLGPAAARQTSRSG